MKRALILILAVLASQQQIAAQSIPITWSGELRIRSEVDGRDFRDRTPPNFYTLSRARIGALVRPVESVSLFFQVQDARAFGEEATTMSSLRNADLHQVYMSVQNFPAQGFSFRLGKMELSYGNGRLIDNNLFANVPRTLGGFIGSYSTGTTTVDLLVLNPRETVSTSGVANRFAYVRDIGDRLVGLWGTTGALPRHAIDAGILYHTNARKNSKGEDSLSVISLGLALKGARGSLFYESDVAFQSGFGNTVKISAWQAGAVVGWNADDGFLRRVSAAADAYSGQSISSASIGVFDPRFGAGHKYLGFMDYFISVPAQTGDRGILDAYLRLDVSPVNELQAQLTVHAFQLMNSFSAAVPLKDLGNEFDCIVRWKHSSALTIEAGACALLPGRVMKAQYGASDPGFWFYASPKVNF